MINNIILIFVYDYYVYDFYEVVINNWIIYK